MINIDKEKCIGCGKCVQDCISRHLEISEGKAKRKSLNCIKCGHCIAICPKDAVSIDEYDMEEVKNYNKEEFSINPDYLLNFIKFRRSVRQFENKEVEEEKICKIIESGRFTQTGINLQDVSYVVVREGLQELKAMTLETLNKIGENILHNLTPEIMPFKKYADMWIQMYQEYKKNPNGNDKLFFNAPAVIIVTANSTINGTLASSNMELMTNALGLGTFFSGFFVKAAQENKRIMEFLGVEKGKQIVTCMIVGYPKVKYLRTVPRKEAQVYWM
ncbi:MAG: nitroreductase family protein [Marinisporobacter sp.]|nr:nitroreductase family protein [Marinisporobacter sp.]